MKTVALLLAAAAAVPANLPGARAVKICAAAGPYWPTMTVALQGNFAWIACKEQSRVIRVDTRTGKRLRSLRLGGPAIAVAGGLGSIWALDSSSTLYRIKPASGRIVKRLALPVSAPYNIWVGGGSVWVADDRDDRGARVVRVAPATNRVVARPNVGDGPADMAFDGTTAWVINHRDRVLTGIDLRNNRSRRVAVLPGDAPERMVWARDRLWITGRGTDLLKVNPDNGAVDATIEIGASGIDVVVDGDDVVVPTRSAAVDVRGFPTMNALKRVSTVTGAVSLMFDVSSRVDVHGLVARQHTIWIADNTNGFLYRVARR